MKDEGDEKRARNTRIVKEKEKEVRRERERGKEGGKNVKIDIVARRVHSLYLPLSSSYTHGLFFSLSLTFFLHTYQTSSSSRHSSSSSSLSVSLLVVSRKGERKRE